MATQTNKTHESGLNKLILNNFIVKNRHHVRRAKVHVSNKITRRAKQLRQQKAGSDQEKEKFFRKADRLIEELAILRKFHEDELSKFALLNRKGLVEVTNDINSTLEERALVRVATWKTVVPEIEKFRGEYPDWEDKIPLLLKAMGLQYRKKRLRRLDMKGRKDQFLEKEHHNMSILQKLTHIDVDRRLLVKARDLMKASKREKSKRSSNEKKKEYGEHSFDKQSRENEDVYGDDSVNTSVGKREEKSRLKTKEKKQQSEEPLDETTNGMQEKVKIGIGTKGEEENVDKSDDEEDSSLDEEDLDKSQTRGKEKPEVEDQEDASEDEESSDISEAESIEDATSSDNLGDKGKDLPRCDSALKVQEMESEEEAYSSDDGDEDDTEANVKTKCSETLSEGEHSEDSENDDHLREQIGKENVFKKRVIPVPQKSHLWKEKRTTEAEVKRKIHGSSDFLSEDKGEDALSNHEEDSAISDDGEDSALSDDEGSIDFDSEGSIVDENFVGEEFTSIWDDFKDKKSKTKPQIGSKKSKKGNVDLSTSGSKLLKSKGTVEVRRLDLTDKKCIDALLEENQEVLSDSEEEEEEDFFVREPKTKKRKRTSENVSCENEDWVVEGEAEEGKNDDGSHSDEEHWKDGHHSDEEISTREFYLNKNFKRIWGKGMEETIRESRGRRGGGRGFEGSRGFGFRGRGFDDNRGRGFNDNRGYGISGSRGRGFRERGFDDNRGRRFRSGGGAANNANLIPLGSSLPSEQSSDTSALLSGGRATSLLDPRSQLSFEPRGGGHMARGSNRENSRHKTGDNTKFGYGRESGGELVKPGWKMGRFEKRDPNNANLMPLMGTGKDNANSYKKESTQGSLLHPSWLAKQKQRELASSIDSFQGKVKRFDFDD